MIEEHGCIFHVRKARGRKYQFILGGPTVSEFFRYLLPITREESRARVFAYVDSTGLTEFCVLPTKGESK